MKLKNILFITFSVLSFSALASSVKDSLRVENIAGKKVILHQVEAKETYYSLGRKYNVSPQSIIDLNNTSLRIGAIIKIPTNVDFKETTASAKSNTTSSNNKKKETTHVVQPKETLYGIATKYKMSVDEVKELNNLTANSLTIGQTLKVFAIEESAKTAETTTPNRTSSATTNSPVVFNNTSTTSTNQKKEITHIVQPKETLFSLAAKYKMRVDEIKKLNNLTSNSLNIGQSLKVLATDDNLQQETTVANRNQETATNNTALQQSRIRFLDSTDSNKKIEIPRNRYGITAKNEKGLAVTINDESLDNTKSYALHSLAPVGTIIKITNPMTNRSVFAKVVGKYTENETTKDVIIVINKAVSEALGALDKRFLVQITYGLPNE